MIGVAVCLDKCPFELVSFLLQVETVAAAEPAEAPSAQDVDGGEEAIPTGHVDPALSAYVDEFEKTL